MPHYFRKLALAASTVVLFARKSNADDLWTAGTGNWFTPGNWNSGVPNGLIDADINNGGTAQIASGSASFGRLSLGASPGDIGSLSMTGGTLNFSNNSIRVGDSGTGTFSQSGGIISNVGTLDVGNATSSTGTYLLSGTGTLSENEFIGYSGTGSFFQSGGLNEPISSLYMGQTGNGAYTLSGGILFVGGNQFVGVGSGSTSTFSLSGGLDRVVGGDLVIGGTSMAVPVSSSYTLAGGTLSVQLEESIGNKFTPALFSQSAGVNTCGTLDLSFASTYNLTGGVLSAAVVQINSSRSSMTDTGGTFTFSTVDQFAGVVLFPGPLTLGAGGNGSNYALIGGTLSAAAVSINSGGLLSVNGGTLSASTVSINSGGLLSLASGTRSAATVATTNINSGGTLVQNGSYSGSVINQNGGSVKWGTLSIFGTNTPLYSFVPVSQYVYASGSFTVGTELVESTSGASFTQTTGINSPLILTIGNGAGLTGTYVQTGGTNQLSSLNIGGGAPGGAGIYDLQGGTLVASTINYNAGATFTQEGGTFSFTTFQQNGGLLALSQLTLATGTTGQTLSLNGGTLSCPTINVNSGGTFDFNGGTLINGAFNQSGGSVNVTALTISGTDTPFYQLLGMPGYNYSSGSISVLNAYVGRGTNGSFTHTIGTTSHTELFVGYDATGTFIQSGGTMNVTQLDIGETTGSSGDFVLSAPGTFAASNESIGVGATGEWDQSGGANTVSQTLRLGSNANSTGTYNLSGGLLTAGTEAIGNLGPGTFNQSGGLNSVTQLTVASSTGQGTYLLAAGSISASNETIGSTGTGSFTQTGGFDSVAQTLNLVRGSYTLSGTGTLTANTITVGTASYIQGGGSATIGSFTSIGSTTLTAGSFNITGTQNVVISATGGFHQNGGSNHASELDISANSASNNAYALSNGTLWVGSEYMSGGGTALFIQSGGMHTASLLQVGDAGSATYVQTGGGAQYQTLQLGGYRNDTGIYSITGGSLSVGLIQLRPFGADGGTGILSIGGTTVTANVVNDAGQISLLGPTDSSGPGTLNVQSNFFGVGEIDVTLGGTIPGAQYGQINVSGNGNIGGGLRVFFSNQYTPEFGDTFNIINAGSLSANFTVDPAESSLFSISYTPTSVVLTTLPEPGGNLPVLVLAALAIPRRRRHNCAAVKKSHRETSPADQSPRPSGEKSRAVDQ
jgi:hypothetical protein